MSDSDIWSEIDEEELLQIEDEQTPKDIVVKGLSAPVDFPFPFTPYDIQKKLMEALYTALEGAKIGIFESPTGTGKSLSIICSTLKWLHDFEEQKMKELDEFVSKPILPPLETNSKASDLPDWMQEFAAKHSAEQTIKQRKVEREAILRKEKKLLELKENLISLPAAKKFKATNCTAKDVSSDFAQIMASASDEIREAYEAEAAEVDDEFLLTQGQQEADVDREDSSDDIHVTKIYYCSRTHSQLSQFVSEIKKSPYADNCRVISLGSRQNMCINPSVLGLKSLSIINDRCKELQKSKSVSCSCPYYNAGRIATLANACLSTVSDIEDIVRRGRKLKACPYYAARKGIPAAQVVALPYNTLLHHSTREASGIHVKDNVVVIDEAHNLLETISNMYSVLISLLALEQCSEQLGEYKTKYLTRFLPQTLRHINLLMHVVDQLCKALQSNKGGEDSAANRLITVNDFLASCRLDHINFFPLLQFCKTSHVSRKLSGFANHRPKIEKETNCQKSGISSLLQTMTSSKDEVAEAHAQESTQQPKKTHVTSPMYQLEALLEALTNPDKDARVVLSHAISEGEDNSTLRYLLLNPALYFSQIVKEARSVIIAGGTMQPVSEFTEQLLHANDSIRGRIVEFSCDHVIPSSQVLPFAVYGDSRGRKLDFTFHSRTKPETLESLASVLCEACEVIPHGVVCFLPSYEYEALMFNYLEKSNWLSKINKFKEVFREPKSSSQLDNILKNYSRSAQRSASSGSNCGAILFSVVGGKMSEGINFSDDLGRCVVMVGLPYPNLFSPELKEKMKYLDKNMKKSTNGPSPGQVHYENLCMKAVNQSIGRAIRHRFDYACMLLLDCRYQRDSIISKLPNWLKSSVRKVEQIPKQTIRKFFLDQREMFKQ